MPKYYPNKICGYYLYYTSFCIIECMHVHASDSRLTESSSAKLFVRSDGSTVVQKQGALTDQELRKIQSFIKEHYLEMYEMWKTDSNNSPVREKLANRNWPLCSVGSFRSGNVYVSFVSKGLAIPAVSR